MATIYNSDLSRELQKGASIQVSRDSIPTQLADKVVPVMEVNPKLLRRINFTSDSAVRTTTGNHTVWTAQTGKDTFITNIQASYVKDVTCDVATGGMVMTIVVDGDTKNFYSFPVITLTAQQDSVEFVFPYALKIDQGSTVTLGGSFTAGVLVRSLSVQGYTVDTINS